MYDIGLVIKKIVNFNVKLSVKMIVLIFPRNELPDSCNV